jgi:YfiH family protein
MASCNQAGRRKLFYTSGAIDNFMVQMSCHTMKDDKQLLTEFNDSRCSHAFFNRHGGEGRSIFSTRNISFGVGDEVDVVRKNRERVKQSLQLDCLVSARQVHGDAVHCYSGELPGDGEIEGVDALITDRPGAGLMIQQADCQAILLFDPVRPAIAAIHCGWRGSVAGIIGKTISRMRGCFGTDPAHLRAAVSPSLGPCCAEFVNYKKELPTAFHRFQVKETYFDFWSITRWQLQECGLKKEAIVVSGICTVCSPDYFSYRRACRNGNGSTGRNCSVIALRRI